MMNTSDIDYDLRRIPLRLLRQLTLRPGLPEPVATYRPVVALTVTRDLRAGGEVLVCVRDRVGNRTHPDVLSSPTRRLHGRDADVEAFAGCEQASCPSWLAAEARELLIDKVGLTAAEAARATFGRAQVWQAESIIGKRQGQIVSEPLTMINVYTRLDAATAVPAATSSYSQMVFASLADHADALARHDSTLLVASAQDGVQPLIYGICTASTAANLRVDSSPGPRLVPGTAVAGL